MFALAHMVSRGDDMSGFDRAVELLPPAIRLAANNLPLDRKESAREFRLRLGSPPTVDLPEGERRLEGCHIVSCDDLRRTVEIATGASPYASARSLKQGYLTAAGGVRIGLCGRQNFDAGENWIYSGLASAAIRIPREVKGCGEQFCGPDPTSALILSPPGAGKTTLLRDMVRLISDSGQRVGLCDEREEVAALTERGPGYDLGKHTDVISGCPKGQAAMQLLRTMSPRWIAMDEITDPEDIAACEASFSGGVKILATAHAASDEDLSRNPLYASLLARKVFSRLIWIRLRGGRREYREVRL